VVFCTLGVVQYFDESIWQLMVLYDLEPAALFIVRLAACSWRASTSHWLGVAAGVLCFLIVCSRVLTGC
jgi:hypothetical protein